LWKTIAAFVSSALWRRAFPPALDFALRFGLRWWQVPLAYGQRLLRYARRVQAGS